MKRSEARILVFLETASKPHRYLRQISAKLQIDYAYVLQIVEQMVEKGWAIKMPESNKIYIANSPDAPTDEAKEILLNGI